MKKTNVFLGIGGNLGDRAANLEETREFVFFNMGNIVRRSSIYQTKAWGMEEAPDFLNQVLEIETQLTKEELLAEIAELEEFYGRKRSSEKYLSREMDVDILYFGEEIIEEESLVVPHPKLHLRKFVLMPLHEIAPDKIHPILKKSSAELLKECTDESPVERYDTL